MKEAADLNLIILLPLGKKSTMVALNTFLSWKQNRHLKPRVSILQGSALKRRDLDRCAYKDSSMAWILPNIYASDTEREDVENAMRALALRRMSPYVRTVALLMR